jgi:hypothetical protein
VARQSDADEPFERADGPTAFESKLVNLIALYVVQERKQSEQITILSRAGFRPAEIAALLGTTPNTVSVELSAQRRARKQKQPPKKK